MMFVMRFSATSVVQVGVARSGRMFVRSIINDVGGAWVEQWGAANTPKQANLADSVSGRMLTTGSFGLGGNVSATALADFNSAVPTGFWSINVNTQNLPATISNNGSSVLCVRLDNNDAFLTAYSRTAGAVNTFIRRERDGVWSDAFLQYNQSNIVGIVSQTAGTPTGAIIQRGSNANGQFTRYADGTAEYWGTRTVTGVTINPASSGNSNTSFAPADPLTLDLTDKVFSVVRANGFAADGTEVYMIRAEPTQQFLNLGTRPADQFPFLNQIGTRVITSYSYAFRAVGRWF
jgi:hypothetical protein